MSRYYDPTTRRFVNADGLVSTGQRNMFIYCNNNSIGLVDSIGAYPTYSGVLFGGGTFSGVPTHQLGYIGVQIKKYWKDGEIIVIRPDQLRDIGFVNVSPQMVDDLNSTLIKANINSMNEATHFIAQCAYESNYGMWLTEIGDQSYFANKAYGYKYRGAGYIQLTWDYNYADFAEYIGDQEIYNQGADYVAKNYAWSAAGWFWSKNNIKSVINGANVDAVTAKINYYTDSYVQRRSVYNHVHGILG